MSEDKKDDGELKYKFEFVKEGSVISLDVGADFFLRLQKLYMTFSQTFNDESAIKEAHKLASECGTYQDFPENKKSAFDLQTLVLLLNEIDTKFREKDLFYTEELPLDENTVSSLFDIWLPHKESS